MSFASLLINTCTIRRFTAGAVDAYGNSAKAWADHLVDEPCRWSTPSNREVKVGAEVVLADILLFLNDVDVTEQDRIVIGTTTYEILSVVRRQDSVTSSHHRELFLRTVK
ncbi:MAG: hypothetical protein PHQ43_10230 [Dehalococcoidales bacterium]|nr:hypothetical protein [Dehalococcoidales bacterium]